MTIKKQTIEEAQKPIGFIAIVPVIPAYNDDGTESKKYILRHNDNIDIGHKLTREDCQNCGNKLKPYKEKFYLKEYWANMWTSYEFSFNNCFCKECAIKLTEKMNVNDYDPSLDKVYQVDTVCENGNFTTIQYADGSILDHEELDKTSVMITDRD